MHSNIWNLCSSKQRLAILQKTQAHKRHLINIITAKSKLNTHSQQLIHHRSFSPLSPIQQKTLQLNNQNLARKLINININKTQKIPRRQLSVSRNLKTYSSLNRIIKQKELQQQNSKIFSRLITTPSTLKRSNWSKSNQQSQKYKQNLHRSRYLQPDYSFQATKVIKNTPKFKCLLVASSKSKSKYNILNKQRFL